MRPWLGTLLDLTTTWGGAVVLVAIGFWFAYQYVEPAPPDTIRMATGDPGGAYFQFGERYRKALSANVTLELEPSRGSVDNLERLTRADSPVDVALVQGGIDTRGLEGTLASIGSVLYEPIWVFHRAGLRPGKLTDLRGKRIGVGGAGSGTRTVALRLLSDNGIDARTATLVESDSDSGADALLAGDLDALFVIASATAPVVRRLALDDRVDIMSFERADAYVRRYRYSARLTLPEGTLDLAADRPANEVDLLAVATNLVVRKDLHPALVDLVLQAASRIHSEAGIFAEPGEFPAPRHLVLPLDDDAERFYRYGTPFLQRYLPFWAANLIDRLKIMLLPLVALLLPLLKATPPIYRWRIRSRVYRWYDDLQHIDACRVGGREHEAAAGLRELDRLQSEVDQVQVPLSYADELYHLRVHMDVVRRDLERAIGEGRVAGNPVE